MEISQTFVAFSEYMNFITQQANIRIENLKSRKGLNNVRNNVILTVKLKKYQVKKNLKIKI